MLRNIKINSRHYFFYPLVFLILLILISVVSIRLVLLNINNYKDEIESIISEHTGYSIDIHKIEAKWKGWIPNLYLEDIKFLNQNINTEIIKFHSATIGVNILQSISQKRVTPSYILISGLNLEIHRNKKGEISIKNNNLANTSKNNREKLTKWFFSQKYLILENLNLIFYDEKITAEKKEFNNVNLELRTKDKETEIDIYITLSQDKKQLSRIKANITGDIFTSSWNGDIDIEMINMDPMKYFDDLSLFSKNGTANGKISTYWQNAKLMNIRCDIDYSDFSLIANNSDVAIKNINADFNAVRKMDKNWSFVTNINNLQTVNGKWPEKIKYQFELIENVNNKYLYKGYVPFLKLEDILPVLIAANILPNNLLQKIDLNSISAEIGNMTIELESSKEDPIQLRKIDADFSKLNFVSNDKSSAINGLQGSLSADDLSLDVKIDSKYPEFRFDKLYTKKIILPNLNAKLGFNQKNYNELTVSDFNILSNEVSLSANGKIILDNTISPFIDISLNLDESNIEYATALIPDKTNPELSEWLNNSMLGGEILSGEISYKGYGEDFLFKNSKSDFKATLNLNNINLDYHEDWPPIDNLAAEVIINNDELVANIISGYIFNAKIDNTSIIVRNLSQNNHHVLINTEIYSHTNDAKNFIVQSPLKNISTIDQLTKNIIGNIDINLNLDIPLDSEEIEFGGLVFFDKASIESGIPELGLENVSGEIYFNVNEIWANNINAIYLGRPVTIKVPTTNYSELDFLPFEISGFLNKQFIIEQITSFFPKLLNNIEEIRTYFSGESQWKFKLQKSENNDIQLSSKKIRLSSDLYGTEVKLPTPLGKDKNEIRPLIVETNILETKINGITINEINIDYNDQVFSDIVIDNQNESSIKNINIGLGMKHPENKNNNTISIQGKINNLFLSDWANLINTSSTEKNRPEQEKIILGEISVENLEIINKSFRNVDINFTNSRIDQNWNIALSGEEINGEVKYTKKSINKNGNLDINLKNLLINENKNTENTTSYKINKIPDLKINIGNFVFKNNKLGHLNLLAKKSAENIINIDELNFKKPGFNINANGSWSGIDGIDKSNFHIKLETDSINKMFETFNYEAANIENGKTLLEINTEWIGSPMDFQLKNLNGQLKMNIEKGQFLDIEPKAGRLFGLLSIQALPRRLSLDFTDFFSEGFAFDSIKGDFNLENGEAYTNNLQMIGPSGDIMINGRTGLVAEDYDQIATVVPKVSDSLPVASALFGPVGVGVGAVLYFAGELFESIPTNIDKILSQQYSIKGNWENPEINKISLE